MLNNINNYILLILINTMGRGAHAAHAAYNGSGTQGISVTNKINENDDMHSVFITQNDTSKQILHGHNISEMTCAGKADGIDSERYKIFTPDENSDMLGDIYLNFEMDSEITEFYFIDKPNNDTPIDMYRFTEEDRRLDLKLAGSELKSLNVDLNTNDIPNEFKAENLDDLGFEVINQSRFIKIGTIDYQFIVGKAKTTATNPRNIAWRNTTSTVWSGFNLEKFQEINCLILETQFPGTSGSLNGIIIFGGLPSTGNDALLYAKLSDFPIKWTNANNFIKLPNFPTNDSNENYYKIVYTLEYYGERDDDAATGRIIVSGSKDHTDEYFSHQTWWNGDKGSPDVTKQTCVVISNHLTDGITYQKLSFINDTIYHSHGIDPIVSSSFSDNTGTPFISVGDKSETLLGIDSNGKLIRSYDNGKNWTQAFFYHGEDDDDELTDVYTHNDDPGFNYFIPKLDYVISNNVGSWIAIGKQGEQASSNTDANSFRQFVFYSDNEGFTWHPIRFMTRSEWTGLNGILSQTVDFYEIVEWLQPSLLKTHGEMEVPFRVKEGVIDSLGNTLPYSIMVPMRLNPFNMHLPYVSSAMALTTWRFSPGPYVIDAFSGPVFNFEYIGTTNDKKKQIYYGFVNNTGLITCAQDNRDLPLSGRQIHTRTTIFDNIFPRSIKYAYRDLLIGVFTNVKVDPDPDINTERTYHFKKSLDGIAWSDIKINQENSILSTKDPLIEGDKYGNFIVAVSSNKYNLYRYNVNSSNLEILFDDTFDITDVFDINFVSNEWQIALKIGDVEFLLKSYDLTKWQKVKNNFGGLNIRQISCKHERTNHIIYKTDQEYDDGKLPPYNFTDNIAYEIFYNTEDGGVISYQTESQPLRGGAETFYINGTPHNYHSFPNKEPNDIIHVNGKIFIASNKNGTISLSYFDFPLVESINGDNKFTEPETIYGDTYLGRVPVTEFASSLKRLYSSPRNPEIIFTVGDFTDTTTHQKYGVILYRNVASSAVYDLAVEGGYYWRVLMGPPLSLYDARYYKNNKGWIESEFETITDVALSKTGTEMVVAGKGKSDYNLVIFQTAHVSDFRNYTTQKLDFDIIYTVANLGNLWVVGGKPLQSDDGINQGPDAVFNNKCVAYTFDLINWKYIDFTPDAVREVTLDSPPKLIFDATNAPVPIMITTTNFEANDIKPLDVYGQTGLLLQISFNWGIDTTLPLVNQPYSGTVQEKIYFMYVSGENLTIDQNYSYPEPSITFREEPDQNRKQLVPSFTTIVNNIERRFVATDYPNRFNLFYVDYQNDKFTLVYYNSNFISNINQDKQRFRKFIFVDENSIIKRTNGHCYKIQKVKNENFVTGINSARYVAVGKGNFSSIIWSDNLLFWNDTDISGIFDITFDITHKHGLWIAIGAGKYQVAISKDGKKWTGIYTKYNHYLPEIDEEGLPFKSMAEFDAETNNITDILPYVPNLKGIFLRNLSLLRLFSRIEYHVGTQIWQTLTFDDIKAMLDTEFGAGEYKNLLKNCSIINKNGSTRFTTWIPGFTKTLNSKLETFSNISESGSFPSGLLKDQKLSIKIYYNKLENILQDTILETKDMNNNTFDNILLNTLIPTDRDTNYYVDSFLADNYGFQLGDTYKNVNGYFKLKFSTEIQNFRLFTKRFELDDIEIDEFNKGIKQIPKMTQSLYFDADNVGYLLLDLDSFNLYASHIIVSGWLTSGVYITDMNLELNGYSYQKIIDPSVIDYATKSYLGLNYNRYTFNGIDKEDGTGSLVIPLASTAYSGSSVPLDRYNSIRLRINLNTLAGPKSYINVTCVGTTTISYNNNTANIDLY